VKRENERLNVNSPAFWKRGSRATTKLREVLKRSAEGVKGPKNDQKTTLPSIMEELVKASKFLHVNLHPFNCGKKERQNHHCESQTDAKSLPQKPLGELSEKKKRPF